MIDEAVEKNRWTYLLTKDKDEYHHDIIRLVQRAYQHTTLGSFVKSVHDVQNSQWLVLDYDHKPDLDIAIFWRGPRQDERWMGRKIQGIGHDGQDESKKRLVEHIVSILRTSNYWIEASDALAAVLLKRGVRKETNRVLLKALFPTIMTYYPDGSYDRMIDGKLHREFVFGRPRLKV